MHTTSHSSFSGWLTSPPGGISALQNAWLTRAGALTVGLRQLGHVQLTVLSEHENVLTTDEAPLIQHPAGEPVWVREIIMHIDGRAAVIARSLSPLAASKRQWAGMRGLATRPLADLLYHDTDIRRSAFRTARLNPEQPLFNTVTTALPKLPVCSQDLLARCSTFWRDGQPLLVEECFLPEFWLVAAQGSASFPD